MDLNNYLFGPLSQDWCMYFYLFSVFWYVLFIITLISIVFVLFSKKIDNKLLFPLVIYGISVFVNYLEKRILHGMCMKH